MKVDYDDYEGWGYGSGEKNIMKIKDHPNNTSTITIAEEQALRDRVVELEAEVKNTKANDETDAEMKVIKAPEALPVQRVNGVVPKSIFLAGSIEMGKAVDWQAEATAYYEKGQGEVKDYVFNPRRDDWDSSWEQSIDNPQFNEQVSWEMTALDIAEEVLLYFCEGTQSPISLLELGLYAKTGKLKVVCPKAFWRRGNVEMVCQRYGIRLFDELGEALAWGVLRGDYK